MARFSAETPASQVVRTPARESSVVRGVHRMKRILVRQAKFERVPPSGQSATGEIGKDQEIRVPLSEERVRTEKQPVVTDEVRVGKRAVQHTENVSDDVRHEELRVDKEGDVDVDSQATPKRKKPAA